VSAPTRPPEGGPPRVATIGARLAARLLDAAVLVVALLPMRLLFGMLGMDQGLHVDASGQFVEGDPNLRTAFMVLVGAVVVGYEVLLIATQGATLGKVAMKLRVVQRRDGSLPGWGRAFTRWAVPTLGLLACLVGELVVYASPLLDGTGYNRGWHDRAAGTVVIRE
jgi:uncharacterized RDD family membrane protein YckC